MPAVRPALFRRALVAFAIASLTAACGGGGDPVQPVPAVCTVSAVSLTPSTANMVIGATAQLVATPTSQNCTPVPTATWTSSAPGIATVSGSGVVTAVAAGSTLVTVTVGAASTTAAINVTPVPIGSLTMTPGSATIVTGASTTLTVVAKDAAGNTITGRQVIFTSSATAVATVASGGIVTGVTPGTTTITATAEGITATSFITVVLPPVASVAVTAPSPTLNVGNTLQATAVLKDANNQVLSGRSVNWTSSSPSVATVNANGLITAVSIGPVTITASSEAQSGGVDLTVQRPVASIAVSPIATQMVPTATVTPTVTLRAADNSVLTGRTVLWSSSSPDVATVNSLTGLITAVAVGTTTITATVEGIAATIAVKVTPTSESNRYASLWADQLNAAINTPYFPDPQFSQNAANGVNTVTRIAVGSYNVILGKMAKVGVSAFRETVLVTAYGSSGEFCRLGSWSDMNGTDLLVRVLCFDIDGFAVNSRFDLALIGSSSLSGQYGFAWNSGATVSAGTPDPLYAFNTNSGNMDVTRTAAGVYATTAGFTTVAKTAAMVSVYGENATCSLDFWNIATGIVTSRCAALNSSVATDARSTVLLMEAGRTGKRWGFVWLNQTSPTLNTPYSSDPAFRNQSNGQNTTVTRTANGQYTVTLPGLGTTVFNGTILVAPYLGGGGPSTGACQVVGWSSNGADVNVTVKCWHLDTKVPTDTRFVLIAIE